MLTAVLQVACVPARSQVDTGNKMNPESLPPYEIDGVNATNIETVRAAYRSFSMAEALRFDRPKGEPGFIRKDFKISLCEIIDRYLVKRQPLRIVLGNETRAMTIIIDIYSVKRKPRDDPIVDDDGSDDEDTKPETPAVKKPDDPLLVVRYATFAFKDFQMLQER